MSTNDFTKPENLEKYSFLWSEVRLIVAAIALLAGGVPVLRLIFPGVLFYGLTGLMLTITWIVSGAASAYLLWCWNKNGRKLFGKKDTFDTAAFLVSAVSGINLGLVGLLGMNVGMLLVSGRFIFNLTAIVYIVASIYLWRRWNTHSKKLFI